MGGSNKVGPHCANKGERMSFLGFQSSVWIILFGTPWSLFTDSSQDLDQPPFQNGANISRQDNFFKKCTWSTYFQWQKFSRNFLFTHNSHQWQGSIWIKTTATKNLGYFRFIKNTAKCSKWAKQDVHKLKTLQKYNLVFTFSPDTRLLHKHLKSSYL